MNKWLKTLAIGDYKVSFGQGLVISNDFTPGRSSIVAQAERRSNGFRRHFSTNENDYFRGVASTLVLKQVYISLLYSYRKLDAGVDNYEVSTFKTDGLHSAGAGLGKETYGSYADIWRKCTLYDFESFRRVYSSLLLFRKISGTTGPETL